MSIIDNILLLISQKRLTQSSLCEAIGINTSTMTNWKNRHTDPPAKYIIPICDFLGVSPYILIYGEEKSSPDSVLPSDEQELLSYYKRLPDIDKGRLIGRAEALSERYAAQPAEPDKPDSADATAEPEKITIKCSCYKVSAGGGFALAEGDDWREIDVEDTPESRKADFAIEVFGSSMEPLISDGDLILVKQQDDVAVGEIGVFIIDGQGYVKKKGPDRLISINDDFDDIYTDPESYSRVVGKVLAVL